MRNLLDRAAVDRYDDHAAGHERSSVADEVLAGISREDETAFEELVHRYQNRIYGLAYRMTGDATEAYDLTQETFMRSYAAMGTFNTALPFAPWLYRIATNLCINFLQSSRVKRGRGDAELAVAVMDPGREPESLYEQRELHNQVHRAVLALPPKYRAVVILRHLQDRTYEEIAAILDIPLNTVRTHLFRARELLRRQLQEQKR